MIYIVWIVLAFVAASVAKNKGRDYGRWLVLSLLISPFISLIILLVSKDLTTENDIKQGKLKNCLYCSELIMREAVKCKHCGADLPSLR